MSEFTCVSSGYVPYQLNIKGIFDSARDSDCGNEIVYKNRRFTYKQFGERVGQFAYALKTLGLQKGSTVAFMDYDTNRYLEAYFAVPMSGMVLFTVNFRFSPPQLVHAFNTARAEVLFINQDFLKLYEAIKDQLTTVKKVVLLIDSNDDAAPGDLPEYEALLASSKPDFEFEDLDENTRATTFFTTGTTGLPKGVYFTHRQLALHTLGAMAFGGAAPYNGKVSRADHYMPMTPMFHVHAWGMPYVATIMGLHQVYPGRYDPTDLLRIIREEKITFTHGVPTLVHMLLNHPQVKDVDFSNFKCIIGGSATTHNLAKQAMEHGIDIYSGWGMSETCPLILTAYIRNPNDTPEEQILERIATGYPAPFCQVRIMDANMNFMPHDGQKQGELVVRAPWLTPGYLGNQDASDNLWHNGWLRTGDIATITPENLVHIVDRLKDVIKTGGEWVSSIDLESVISRHPAVQEVAVVGRPDPKWGERPVAFVVLKDGEDATQEEIQEHVKGFIKKGELPPYSTPDDVHFVDSIPRTSVGKLNKKVIREQFLH